jgi:hypothetical protein
MLNGAKSQGSETEEAGLAQAVDESPESERLLWEQQRVVSPTYP